MRDPRNARLADVIVRHSTRLVPGEVCLVEAFDVADGLVIELVEAIQRAQAIPLVSLRNNAVTRSLLHGAYTGAYGPRRRCGARAQRRRQLRRVSVRLCALRISR